MTIEDMLTDPLVAMMNAADAIETKTFALLLRDAAGRVRSGREAREAIGQRSADGSARHEPLLL
jgi:hypothetical protein